MLLVGFAQEIKSLNMYQKGLTRLLLTRAPLVSKKSPSFSAWETASGIL